MPSKVVRKVWPSDGPSAVAVLLRIVGLQPGVEADQEVLEVESQPQPIGESNLAIEVRQAEVAFRLIVVWPDGPDVPRIDVGRQLKLPKESRAVFNIRI